MVLDWTVIAPDPSAYVTATFVAFGADPSEPVKVSGDPEGIRLAMSPPSYRIK
jgi:hypothetical protein